VGIEGRGLHASSIAMAEYNGRRAPNFSQYLDDLNAIPSAYDVAMQQQQQQQEAFNLDNELSLFTNTEFFDFDKLGDLNIPQFDHVEENKQSANQSPDMEFLDMLGGKWILLAAGLFSSPAIVA
jgi:hypothetical protein